MTSLLISLNERSLLNDSNVLPGLPLTGLEALDRSRGGMEAKPEARDPDSSRVGTVDASCLDVTVERLEQLTKSMEVLLCDVEQMRSQCSHRASELTRAASDLRRQQEELKESYSDLSREMQDVMESVDELFSTKSAFEAKEKQTQKLSRQL